MQIVSSIHVNSLCTHQFQNQTKKPTLFYILHLSKLCSIILLYLINIFFSVCYADLFRDGIVYEEPLYTLATEYNDASAQYILGRRYLKEKNNTKNVLEAEKWLVKAVQQGHIKAKYELGKLYLHSNEIVRKRSDTLKLLTEAASDHMIGATYELGNYYIRYGKGAEKYLTAAKWFRRAAKKDHGNAQYDLAKLLYAGKGVKKDKQQAKNWFVLAEQQGVLRALQFLKEHYTDSKHSVVKSSAKKSKKISTIYKSRKNKKHKNKKLSKSKKSTDHLNKLQTSIKNGSAKARYIFGLKYLNGDGVPKNLSQARYWIQDAAKRNYPDAQFKLGVMYQQGLGLVRDPLRAKLWLKRASNHGVVEAEAYLQKILR